MRSLPGKEKQFIAHRRQARRARSRRPFDDLDHRRSIRSAIGLPNLKSGRVIECREVEPIADNRKTSRKRTRFAEANIGNEESSRVSPVGTPEFRTVNSVIRGEEHPAVEVHEVAGSRTERFRARRNVLNQIGGGSVGDPQLAAVCGFGREQELARSIGGQ